MYDDSRGEKEARGSSRGALQTMKTSYGLGLGLGLGRGHTLVSGRDVALRSGSITVDAVARWCTLVQGCSRRKELVTPCHERGIKAREKMS